MLWRTPASLAQRNHTMRSTARVFCEGKFDRCLPWPAQHLWCFSRRAVPTLRRSCCARARATPARSMRGGIRARQQRDHRRRARPPRLVPRAAPTACRSFPTTRVCPVRVTHARGCAVTPPWSAAAECDVIGFVGIIVLWLWVWVFAHTCVPCAGCGRR